MTLPHPRTGTHRGTYVYERRVRFSFLPFVALSLSSPSFSSSYRQLPPISSSAHYSANHDMTRSAWYHRGPEGSRERANQRARRQDNAAKYVIPIEEGGQECKKWEGADAHCCCCSCIPLRTDPFSGWTKKDRSRQIGTQSPGVQQQSQYTNCGKAPTIIIASAAACRILVE